ncbi:MAG: hypothetical protein H6935_10880 [Thiobacillus sp.]|nr:hypothetical protein [Thiobacillus sp.]
MVLRLLNNLLGKASAEFGSNLANRLSLLYPPSLDKPGDHKISANRIANILEGLYGEAQSFRYNNKLGLIGRTRLSHAFKWRLIEHNYSKEFIDMATEGLVVYLHKPLNSAENPKKSPKR